MRTGRSCDRSPVSSKTKTAAEIARVTPDRTTIRGVWVHITLRSRIKHTIRGDQGNFTLSHHSERSASQSEGISTILVENCRMECASSLTSREGGSRGGGVRGGHDGGRTEHCAEQVPGELTWGPQGKALS